MRKNKSKQLNHNMKKVTSTSAPVIPDGWIPKPDTKAYNFLDWCVNYHEWCKYIRASVHVNVSKLKKVA